MSGEELSIRTSNGKWAFSWFVKNDDVSKIYRNKDNIIVILKDGSKGVAKCSKDDEYDEFIGFCIAYTKAKFRTGSQVRKALKKLEVQK